MVGCVWLSTATSPHVKPVAGLKREGESGNSSPSLKNPKKANAATAQRTTLSGFCEVTNDYCMACIIWIVIGSLMRGGEPLRTRIRLIPAWTLLRIGSDD